VLAEQRSVGGDGIPDRNPSRFVELLLRRSIEKHGEAGHRGGVVLFDRGVPDCVAYAERLGADPEASIRAASEYRYNQTVLVARPWAEIYTTDEERTMTYESTLEFQRSIERAYEAAGYALVEIPRAPIEARITFVKEFLGW
jgi:predicted ATPase